MPMTGTVGAAGQEVVAAVKLYMAQHGDTVAGKKIELIIRDDGSIPDNAKRLAQELVGQRQGRHPRRRHDAERHVDGADRHRSENRRPW